MKRNRNYGKLTIIISLIFTITSCTDIMDPDISSKDLSLLAPTDSLETNLSTHTFWWTEVEFAEEYNLQIASPTFMQAERLIMDTVLLTNKFIYGLTPGKYEWRVQARNTRSSTDYQTNSLKIDPSLDISEELLQLLKPGDNDTTNLNVLEFKWIKLYNADEYILNLFHNSIPVKERTTDKDTIIIPLSWGDGSYQWKLKAKNKITETLNFERSFFIDTEAPEKPVLKIPNDKSTTINKTINFNWDRKSNPLSSEKDSLVVYVDSPSTPSVAVELKKTEYTITLEEGTYKWYVKTFDKAGNLSNQSEIRTITIENN